MTQERFKFRHVNELTGLLVLAVFALVVAGVLYSGQSQRWFAQKYAFDVLLPESGAFGLRRGDEVFIAGVSVGLVDDIRVGQDRRMKAHVKVRGDFERFVRLDSTAAIKKFLAWRVIPLLKSPLATASRYPRTTPKSPVFRWRNCRPKWRECWKNSGANCCLL